MSEFSKNPIVPAYRLAPDRCDSDRQPISELVIFRCPACGDIHTHGAGNGSAMQWRGSHCCAGSPLAGKNVRLLVCGTVASRRMLPHHSAAEIAELNKVVAEIGEGGRIVPLRGNAGGPLKTPSSSIAPTSPIVPAR